MKCRSFIFAVAILSSLGCDSGEMATEVENEVVVDDQPQFIPKVDCEARPEHPKCTGGGSDEPCEINFSLSIAEQGTSRLLSDDGPYVHDVDRVRVRTGKSGNGWRFDTNSINRLESHKQVRTIKIDFTDVKPVVQDQLQLYGVVNKGIDMRFQPDELNLCQVLETDLAPAAVSIGLRFDTPNTELFPWNGWGVIARYGATGCAGGGDADPVYVTRTGQNTWTFVGTTACLERLYDNDVFVSEVFSLPFEFHLTRR